MNEWDNPWGSAGGYSLPPAMALMPEYWIMYPLDWWLAEEYDADEAYTFWASWDGLCAQSVELKTNEFLVTAVRDAGGEPPELFSPVASFTASPLTAPTGTAIDFDASLSSDSDGTIVLYEWDWNSDGTYDYSSASPTASYAYSEDNIYPVTLRVTDNDGLTDTATVEVTVYIEQIPAIPEVPLGTIVISASMIIALAAYFGLPRLRRENKYIKL